MTYRWITRSLPLLVCAMALSGCSRVPLKSELPASAPATPEPMWPLAYSSPTAQRNPDTNPLGTATEEARDGAPADPDDVWARLRARFSLSAAQDPRIDQELAWYRAHPEYFARISARARPYLYFIADEVEKRGLPGEIALLPAVESSFEPLAYSPGHAAGIWQFIPSTGRMFGLKQTWWYDGRRDVTASTRAALEYLDKLSTRFDGDWELALASYNAGAGTVDRAISKNRRMGRPSDFWSLDLPAETEVYLPRLLALAQMIADPDAYGISLEPIPNEPHFASVNVGSQIDLTLAAELADLSIEELCQLNPGLSRWATDPTGPHRLHLPVDKLDTFRSNLVQLEPEERMRWQRYRVRAGDTLGSIAARHGTSVAQLQRVNQLKNPHLLRVGQQLLLPRYSELAEPDRPDPQATGLTQGEYLVRLGDSLWTIARRFRVSVEDLKRWNELSGEKLQPGQKLVLYVDVTQQQAL